MVDIPTGAPIVYVSFSAGVDINSAENLMEVMANCAFVNTVYRLGPATGRRHFSQADSNPSSRCRFRAPHLRR